MSNKRVIVSFDEPRRENERLVEIPKVPHDGRRQVIA